MIDMKIFWKVKRFISVYIFCVSGISPYSRTAGSAISRPVGEDAAFFVEGWWCLLQTEGFFPQGLSERTLRLRMVIYSMIDMKIYWKVNRCISVYICCVSTISPYSRTAGSAIARPVGEDTAFFLRGDDVDYLTVGLFDKGDTLRRIKNLQAKSSRESRFFYNIHSEIISIFWFKYSSILGGFISEFVNP